MKRLTLILLSIALISICQSQPYPDCKGSPNPNGVIHEEPQFLANVTNGKKFLIQDPNDSSVLTYIVMVKGTPYEMGYAYGELLKDEITKAIPLMYEFIEAATPSFFQDLPQWMQDLGLSQLDTMELGMRLEYISTLHYLPQRYIDEMKGVADASGANYNQLLLLNLFPELIRAACTIAGIWGDASKTGNLLQLRALDWDARMPLGAFPVVTVYHSNEENAQPYANFGWPAIIGSLAAYSHSLAMSQKVWLPFNDTISSNFGEPWMFVFRDTMTFGTDLKSAIDIIENANRTYQVHLGIGSRKDNQMRGLQYSYGEVLIYDDKNFSKPFSNAHPQLNGIMFWDEDIAQTNACIGNIFKDKYGEIDAQTLYELVTPLRPTGNTLIAVYDFENDGVYLAYAEPKTVNPAYNRTLMYLNMTNILDFDYQGRTMVINE